MPDDGHDGQRARGPAGLRGPILVVEDDDDIRTFVADALADEGYEVVAAPQGAAALEVAGRCAPALILLDMKMVEMDGWEFARRYRQAPPPHAPIVVMTAAHDAPGRAVEVDAAGAIAKPFQVDVLLAVVGRFVGPGDA